MGFFQRKPTTPEQAGGAGLSLDLDVRACPTCRRELHPWEERCPDDGAEGVDPTSLQSDSLPPPPAHLMGDDVDEEPGTAAGAPVPPASEQQHEHTGDVADDD